MKKILCVLISLMIITGVLIGCGQANKQYEEAENAVNVFKEGTTDIIEDVTKDEDVREIETSNTLVVYSAGPSSLSSAIEQAFEADTGIEVELFQSTTGKILAKLEAEKNNPVADVVVLASWPSAMELKSKGMTQAYKSAANSDKLYEGFVDEDYHLFGYSASALGITYNTNLVNEPIKDWSDFTEARWINKVNIPDPSLSGSCMDFISGYIETYGESGWSLFEKLNENGVTIGGANKAALEPVLTGSKSAVLAGVDYMAYSNMAKGEPINIVYPESGTVVNPRAVAILKEAKNVEAARIYVDYMLSDTVQQLVIDEYIIPGRSDIKSDNRANMEDIPLLEYDWAHINKSQEENIKKFNDIFSR